MATSERFGPVQVRGRDLRCNVCSHDIFWEHELQLATPIFNFRENDVAQCAVCERCGYVHMFISPATFARDSKPEAEAPPPDVAPGAAPA